VRLNGEQGEDEESKGKKERNNEKKKKGKEEANLRNTSGSCELRGWILREGAS
jgi:hypothetical protein